MSDSIRLYNLGPSPNSTKVRLALGLKGIAHDVVNVNPGDRSEVVKVSGQPLTPVLTHGDTVVFDSSAILRYLEANVKREPRLYSEDYEQMKAIEGWESWARTDLAPGVGQLFGQFFADTRDETVVAKCVASVNAAAKHLESSIKPSGFLVGDHASAADITTAAWLSLGFLSPEASSSHPMLGFFHERLSIDPERQALRRWYQGIARYDR